MKLYFFVRMIFGIILIAVPGSAVMYISNVSGLPENNNNNLRPDSTFTPSIDSIYRNCGGDTSRNCIYGWLDIVGFRNVARMNGIDYINEPVKDAMIVRYQTDIRINGRYFLKGWEYHLENLSSGNTVTAHLTAKAILYQVDQDGYVSYDNETMDFYDTETAPVVLEYKNPEIQVVFRERNFTIYNTSDIEIKVDDTIYDKYRVMNKDGYFEKINRVWRVEQTPKGVYYANEFKIDIFEANNISHSQNIISVKDLNFTVTASGFFSSTNKMNVTKTYEESDPTAQFLDNNFLGFLSVLSVIGVYWMRTVRGALK